MVSGSARLLRNVISNRTHHFIDPCHIGYPFLKQTEFFTSGQNKDMMSNIACNKLLHQ